MSHQVNTWFTPLLIREDRQENIELVSRPAVTTLMLLRRYGQHPGVNAAAVQSGAGLANQRASPNKAPAS